MPVISPRLGEFLVKTTGAKDIDNAFQKIFSDYLELKLKSLQEIIEKFQAKWGMDFDAFREMLKTNISEKEKYSFDVEQDFWKWEESETLKKHYEVLLKEWI